MTKSLVIRRSAFDKMAHLLELTTGSAGEFPVRRQRLGADIRHLDETPSHERGDRLLLAATNVASLSADLRC